MAHKYNIDTDIAQIIKNRGYSDKEGMAIKSLAKSIILESQALKVCLGADTKIFDLEAAAVTRVAELSLARAEIRKLKSDLEEKEQLIHKLHQKAATLRQYIDKHRNTLAEFLDGYKE